MVCCEIEKRRKLLKQSTIYLSEGYLHLTDGKYPVVKVTPNAIPVLKGQENIWMKKTLSPVCTYGGK